MTETPEHLKQLPSDEEENNGCVENDSESRQENYLREENEPTLGETKELHQLGYDEGHE